MKEVVLKALYQLRLMWRKLTKPLTLGVRCFVVRDDGHILLVRHTYLHGWYLPGGGVDRGETLEAAIRRELHEEVGVELQQRPQIFHAYSNFREHKSDHVVLFAANVFTMRPSPNAEIAEHGFFPPGSPPETTSRATRRRLQEWLAAGERAEMW